MKPTSLTTGTERLHENRGPGVFSLVAALLEDQNDHHLSDRPSRRPANSSHQSSVSSRCCPVADRGAQCLRFDLVYVELECELPSGVTKNGLASSIEQRGNVAEVHVNPADGELDGNLPGEDE